MKTLAAALAIAFRLLLVRGQGCPTQPGCAGCTSVRRIICTSGGLTAFPNLPPDLQQGVEELTLRNNGLTRVTAADLVNYTSLEMIVLSFNNISYIEPGSFNLTTLTRIDLSNNQISSLPDNLFANTQLTSLVAASNLIENITSATFTGLENLATINLDDNRIQTFGSDTFSAIPGMLDTLILTNNPLVCDCNLRWIVDFVNRNSTSSPLSSSLGTCDVPILNLMDAQVSGLMASDFLCDCIPPCVNGTCNTVVGMCECSDGYIGDLCDTVCPAGSYGAECMENCTCVVDHESSPCDHVDGMCYCLPGYNGSSCETECMDGYFGHDCVEVCLCQNEASCDFRTGSCDCTAGWMGRFCDTPCLNGTYGPNCSQTCTCSVDHQSAPCDRFDGQCFCQPGYTGTTCNMECPEGSFGQDCDNECECQNGASCDPVTGDCVCAAGWIGEICNKSCSAGFYGVNCSQLCTCIEDNQIRACDHISGQCHCLSNFTGQNCETYLKNRNVGPGVIAGSVLVSVAGVLILTILMSVVMFLLMKMNKKNLTISPSQQFKTEKVSLELSTPPSKQTLSQTDNVIVPNENWKLQT